MTLNKQLLSGQTLFAPGVFDALSAILAERAGFGLAFMSGSAVSCAQLARPDVGLITLNDVAGALDKMCDRVTMPIMVDVDSGFGNAMNVSRTVRTLERAGAAGVQLEDQKATKGTAEVMSRPLVATAEMVDKIKAAQDAKQKAETLISARTDAAYDEGVGAAIERGHRYIEAGADLLFIEGIVEAEVLQTMQREYPSDLPLVYNAECLRGTEPFTFDQLSAFGYSVVLYPGVLLRSMASAGADALDDLLVTVGRERSGSSSALADVLQTQALLKQYVPS